MLPIAKFGLPIIVVILATLHVGHSLECVYCNSTEYSIDEECARGSVASKLTCTYDTPCFYAVYNLGGGGAGQASRIAFRGCMYQGTNCAIVRQRAQHSIQRPIVSEECRTCNTHLCNSASTLSTSLVVAFVIHGLTRIF